MHPDHQGYFSKFPLREFSVPGKPPRTPEEILRDTEKIEAEMAMLAELREDTPSPPGMKNPRVTTITYEEWMAAYKQRKAVVAQ